MKALTYKQYRTINILLLAFLFTIAEFAVTLGANVWFKELPYALSLAVLFVSLELMRWGWYGTVAVVVSGLVFCFASGAEARQYEIYCIGNLFMLFGLLFLKTLGHKRVAKSMSLTVLYILVEFLLAISGRTVVAIIQGTTPLIFVQFLTTDALSCLFAIIVILLARNADGMFEYQRDYLARMEEEKNEG